MPIPKLHTYIALSYWDLDWDMGFYAPNQHLAYHASSSGRRRTKANHLDPNVRRNVVLSLVPSTPSPPVSSFFR